MPKRLNESLDDNGVVAALRESGEFFSYSTLKAIGLIMGSLRSQPSKQIGEIAFHQRDLIPHVSKHRRSFIHQFNVEILVGCVGASEQRDPPLPLRRIRGSDATCRHPSC